MKARSVVVAKFGTVNVLQTREFELPDPEENQITIAVHYAGINFADIIARRGYYEHAGQPPFTPGFEVSGRVAKAGKKSGYRENDSVLAVTRFGGYSNLVNVSHDRTFKLRAKENLKSAAALPAVYLTSLHSLQHGLHFSRGESILIHSVAGGIGIAASQLCRNQGLEIFGTASSRDKLEFASQHGLHHGIDSSHEDFVERVQEITNNSGIDLLLDSLGGTALVKSLGLLKPMGRAVTIGGAGILPPDGHLLLQPIGAIKSASEYIRARVHPLDLISRNISLAGVQLLLLWDHLDHLRGLMSQILKEWRAGKLAPHIHATYPLENAGSAHTSIESRTTRGKLLLSTEFAD